MKLNKVLLTLGLLAIAFADDDNVDDDDDDDDDRRGPSCRKMKKTVQKLADTMVYPNPVPTVVSNQLPTDIFANGVVGRVTPLGAFDGDLNSLEYFFGLAVGDYAFRAPFGLDPTSAVVDTVLNYAVCDRKSRIVSFSYDFYSGPPGLTASDLPFSSAIVQTGGVKFNEQGQICAYDWALQRLGAFTNTVLTSTNAGDFASNAQDNIQQLCGGIDQVCIGDNRQYADVVECIAFMNSIPYGSWDNVDLNNVICRQLHFILAAFRPDTHCSHAGPTGGGKCEDRSYSDMLEFDYLSVDC